MPRYYIFLSKARSALNLSIKICILLLLLMQQVIFDYGTIATAEAAIVTNVTFGCTAVTEIPQLECEALVALYNSTDGVRWQTNTDWLQTNAPCTWYGVTCTNGHIDRLILLENQLAGVIPPQIENLSALTYLNVNDNQITGLPLEIGNLSSLVYLSASNTQLTELPSEIGNLSLLRLLLVHNTQLKELPAEIGSLSALTHFYVGNTQLKELPAEVWNLRALTHLDIHDIRLKELPPEIGNLSSLVHLYGVNNQLTGLPSEIGNLSALLALDVRNNQITELPSEIGNLSALTHLYVNGNQLTGLPSEIGNLSALLALDVGNNQITELPSEVWGLSALTHLFVNGNQLTGCIPQQAVNLQLSVFRFHQTQWQEPQDEEFQMWIQGVNDVSRSGIVCELSSQVQIVVFAGDNQPTSPAHVGTKYRPMMDGIVEASRGLTHTLAVVLGDQTGADNTRIQLVQNGVVSTVVGLPDTTGVLTTTVTEYDMADGAQLGGFLRWTLDNYTDATTNVTLSYYGHGTYLAPAVDMEAAFTPLGEARAALPSAVADVLFPLPYLVDAFPNFTDVYPKKSLITPYALQQMLEIGTRGGQTPIEVLDLTHCFAFSLEEVYELTNDGGTPYAEMIVGSANYAYFASEMVGDVLSVLDPNTDAKTQAIAIVDAYDAAIGEADLVDEDIDVDHPRTFAVVESAVLNTTAGGSSIKMLLDDLSYYLLDEFNADPAATIVKLQAAASATLAYDTSYCKQDWELGNPDALLDAGAFLANIVDQFGLFTRVGLRANQLRNVLENAVVAHTSADGIPWYATPAPSEAWMLDNEDALGISMFANFFGRQLGADYPAEKRLLPWQMRYYTHDTTLNPHPYRLITPDAHNTPTWADLLQRYWEEREQTEGLLIHTEACLTDLPAVKRTGEVTALAVTAPHVGTLFLGYSTPIRATISAETQLINPLVTFNVSLNNQIIFTNTIAAGSLLTGTYQVESSQPFTPTERGHYTFHVTVDSDNRFKEQNETDNFASHIERASPLHPFEIDATVAGHHQWITDSTALLTITSSEAVDDIIVQIYQYQAGDSPNTQLPRLLGHVRVGGLYYIAGGAYSMVTLPESVEPGIVTLHVWGFANDKMTQSAEIVEFNYAPDNMQLAAGSRTYFRFSADVNQTIGLDLDLLNGDVEMRVWEPGNRWTARQLEQSGVMLIEPTFRGRYLVEIESLTASILSRISSTRDGVPNRRAIADVRWVNVQQPTFVDPVMEPVVEPVTAVKLVENDVAAPHMRVWPIALLLLVCLSGWILRRKPMR